MGFLVRLAFGLLRGRSEQGLTDVSEDSSLKPGRGTVTMKVKVNRLLNAGKYRVNFEVSDFTPEELAKMSSFGVPGIDLKLSSATATVGSRIPLNQINKSMEAVFVTPELATAYVEGVLTQIKASMQRLRESKDVFTSSLEVEL
jgi:hypothetical protein